MNVTYKEYGANNFTFLYDKDTLMTFGYFKTNNWHGHKHIIQLTEDTITVKVKGPDEDKFYINKIKDRTK